MLAIIIPYYKLTFFEATLASLAAQTCQDFKAYIGDDASPEDPSNLIEKYKGQFDFVYHRFDENLGGTSLTKQWERCIALSGNEEWLMILGDDDVLGENVVKEFYDNLPKISQRGNNVIRYATQIIDGNGELISDIYTHPKLEKATDSFWRKFTGETRSSLSEYIFSRLSYEKFGFKNYPLAWHSDDMAWLEFSNFKNIYSINSAKVFVRITDLSISGKKDNVKLKQKATFNFYYYLIMFKLNYFNPFQRIELFKQINKFYINDKKNYTFFFKLTYFYWSRLLVVQYFQFLRSSIVNIINAKTCE